MNQLSSIASLGQPSAAKPQGLSAPGLSNSKNDPRAAAELREAYTQFVGETLFGSMLKAARKTVGEPAYFHGGMAEEQFQARLDAQWAADLAKSSGSFAQGLFRSEFPAEAQLLDEAKATRSADLAQLDTLVRR
ncbi:MAG: hypothetical protein AAF805_07195 [Planctomycetota bacterium]